jgi:hypothetical protein
MVEAGDEPYAAVVARIEPQCVADEEKRDRKAKDDPCEVLLQVTPSRRIPF